MPENGRSRTHPAVVVSLDRVLRRFPGQTQAAVDHVSLSVQDGEILSLVGESGCGKTTTLRMIAGFETPDGGTVTIGDRRVAGNGFIVPPNKRPTGIVFQEHALFPHKTVSQNIAFGLSHMTRRERRRRIDELVELAALEGLSGRYPHELSGGQAQRVALARALAPRPEVILLDEPFNNLDSTLRFRLLRDVETLIRTEGTTGILVTHDWQEAFAVSDRIAVMNKGRVLQIGTPREVYEKPQSRFVAEFFGPVNQLPPSGREASVVHIRPRDVLVCRGTHCPYANCRAYQGLVERTRFLGEYQEVLCRVDGSKAMAGARESGSRESELHESGHVLTAYAPAQLDLSDGETIVAACPESLVLRFDDAADGGSP